LLDLLDDYYSVNYSVNKFCLVSGDVIQLPDTEKKKKRPILM